MYFTAIVEKMEKQLTEIVRKLAIENQELREKVADYEIKLLKNKEGDNKAEKVAGASQQAWPPSYSGDQPV